MNRQSTPLRGYGRSPAAHRRRKCRGRGVIEADRATEQQRGGSGGRGQKAAVTPQRAAVPAARATRRPERSPRPRPRMPGAVRVGHLNARDARALCPAPGKLRIGMLAALEQAMKKPGGQARRDLLPGAGAERPRPRPVHPAVQAGRGRDIRVRSSNTYHKMQKSRCNEACKIENKFRPAASRVDGSGCVASVWCSHLAIVKEESQFAAGRAFFQ